MTTPFFRDEQILPYVVGYTNEEYIADLVMPPETVSKELFRWQEWNSFSEHYNEYNNQIARDGDPYNVQFSATSQSGVIRDYAFMSSIPIADLEAAENPIDLGAMRAVQLKELQMIAREVRVAAKVQSATNYVAANQETLAPADQFSNVNSQPIRIFQDAIDKMDCTPNIAVMNRPVYNALRRHPQIVEAIRGTGADQGVVSRQQLADLLELEAIYVGTPKKNIAKEGQTPNRQRIWNKNVALLRVAKAASLNGVIQTWGMTAVLKPNELSTWIDPKPGTDGVQYIKIVERCEEVVVSKDAGYLFINAIA